MVVSCSRAAKKSVLSLIHYSHAKAKGPISQSKSTYLPHDSNTKFTKSCTINWLIALPSSRFNTLLFACGKVKIELCHCKQNVAWSQARVKSPTRQQHNSVVCVRSPVCCVPVGQQ